MCWVARRILHGELAPREGCRLLAAAHGGNFERDEIQAFWLLDMAVQANEEEGFQYYDQRFEGHNFDDLVLLEARCLREETCGAGEVAE